MNLISMEKISQEEIEYLRTNNNTGIEYEYAVFVHLIEERKAELFIKTIVEYHNKKEKIISTIDNINISSLTSELNINNFNCKEVFIATQVDEVGPSDLLLKCDRDNILGLSIKYGNNCAFNVTSKEFLTKESIDYLKTELDYTCKNYVHEMREKYGEVSHWFRTRKRSEESDRFIDKARDLVIYDWKNKSNIEKKILLEKLTHSNSPIKFWIVNIKKNLQIEIVKVPFKVIEVDHIKIEKYQSSFLEFKINNKPFARMQVKFNNGILERNNNNYIIIDDIELKAKPGDPFGSWNFSLLNY